MSETELLDTDPFTAYLNVKRDGDEARAALRNATAGLRALTELEANARAEVARLVQENTLLSEGAAKAGWWSPATAKAYGSEVARLKDNWQKAESMSDELANALMGDTNDRILALKSYEQTLAKPYDKARVEFAIKALAAKGETK